MPGVPLDDDLRQLAERHHRSAHGRHQHLAGNLLRVGAQLTRIAYRYPEALTALNSGGHHLTAQRAADHILQLANGKTVAGQLFPVGLDVEVEATGDALGKGTGGAGHRFDDRLDLLSQFLHFTEILAEDLDADRRTDAGGQHVGAGLDRHRPGIGHTRELQRLIHFRDQLVGRHAGTPFGLRLEVDDRLEHLGRRRVGGGIGTAGLAKD